MIDYKFWYIKRDDNGFITEAAVRFYEGEVNTKPEADSEGVRQVTRYRRTKRLTKEDVNFNVSTKLDSAGNEAFIYTYKDFGDIKDDDELRVFLNKELKKDSRVPIDIQKEVNLERLKRQPTR